MEHIATRLSFKTISRIALYLMRKNKNYDIKEAVDILNTYFAELHNARMATEKIFYINFPVEIEKYRDNEKLYSVIVAMYYDAYKQGYTNGVVDLDRVINAINEKMT